jgi:hypothetical protein
MEIYKIYENVLSELRKGHRPRLQLSNQQYEHIINELSELKELKVNLCLACHLRNPSPVFQPVLLKLLEENNNQLNELIPFIVEACTRHFIEYQHQYGEPVPPRFFKALAVFLGRCPKTLLSYPLGLVESLGGKSIYFKKVIEDLEWGFQSIFSKDQRHAIQIIKRIEKSWPR